MVIKETKGGFVKKKADVREEKGGENKKQKTNKEAPTWKNH